MLNLIYLQLLEKKLNPMKNKTRHPMRYNNEI